MVDPRIVILSDLNWHIDSKRINRADILMLFESRSIGSGQRFYRIDDYYRLITAQKPSLVIFAGDVTGDGSCGHGFQTAFYYLLALLQLQEIPTLFIRGDNDLDSHYNAVVQGLPSLPLVKEISDSTVNIQGLSILGISYQTTADKKQIKTLLSQVQGMTFDLTICHCPLKRRTSLLDINTACLVTGHFDNKLFSIDNKTFISLSNDSEVINFVTVTYKGGIPKYNYLFASRKKHLQIRYESVKDNLYLNDVPVDIAEYEKLKLPRKRYDKDKNALALSLKYLRGQDYKRSLELMLKLRSGELEMDSTMLTRHMKNQITSKHKLSKSMLVDFLGNAVWKYLK